MEQTEDVKKTVESRHVAVMRGMPSLSNWPGKGEGVKFEAKNSEVGKWMMSQGEVLSWMIAYFKRMGAIRYSEGKWVGVGYGDVVSGADLESGDKELAESLGRVFTVGSKGGRPSRVLELMNNDHGAVEKIIELGITRTRATGFLVLYLIKRGVRISSSTAHRFLKLLVENGVLGLEQDSKGVVRLVRGKREGSEAETTINEKDQQSELPATGGAR